MAGRKWASHMLSTALRAAYLQRGVPIRRPVLLPAARSFVTTDEVKPPKMPETYECCGNGCDSCVWDRYFKELAAYKKRKRDLSATRAAHEERKQVRGVGLKSTINTAASRSKKKT